MLYQLDLKLRNQLSSASSASSIQASLASIKRTITGFYHRSRIKQPHSQLLPLLHLPTLAVIAAEVQPIYGDIDQHCNPLTFHKHRETLAHSFAIAASSSRHPLPALLQPRPFLLVGRLTHRASDVTRLVLVDDTASIACHIMHADASLLQQVVLFMRFNLVFPHAASSSDAAACSECGVLELDGRHAVVLFDVDEVDWDVLRPLPLHAMNQTQIRQLFKPSASATSSTDARPASCLSSSLSSSGSCASSSSSSARSRATHHLRGFVSAISPIIQQGGQRFFFVDLRYGRSSPVLASQSTATASLPSADSAFILFQGAAAMCWYHCLHVDSEYLITHLRPKAFKLSDGRVKLLFVFTSASTPVGVSSLPSATMPHVFSAASCELPPFAPSPAADSAVAQLHKQVTPLCKWAHTVDYVGTITKQVCAGGVYELDHNGATQKSRSISSTLAASSTSASQPAPSLRLFVTHYAPIVQDGLLLRPGCVVRLHHVHPLVHSGRFLGFGCCSRSHVAVVQLSPFAELCKPYDAAGTATLTAQLSRLSLSDAALYLSVMDALLRQWSRRVKSDLIGDGQRNDGLILRLLSSHVRPQHQPNIYAEVMDHATCDSAVPGSNATDGFPTFPSYSSLFQLPAVVSAYESLLHRIHGTDHSSTAWHAACIPSDRLLPAGWFVTGYLSPTSLPFKTRAHTVSSSSAAVHVNAATLPRPSISSVCTGMQLRGSLRDKPDAIDCEVRGIVSGEHCVVLYHLPSFQLVLETVPPVLSSSSGPLPPVTSAAANTALIVAYMSFSMADAVRLITPIPRAPRSTVFTSQRTHTSVLLYITHKICREPVTSPAALFLVPHHDLPASCLASSAALHGHECSLRGLLVSANVQSPSSLLVHLRPPVQAMSSVVHVGAVVELSSCRQAVNVLSLNVSEVFETTEDCALRIDQSAAAVEWQHAARSHLPAIHAFDQLLTVDMDEWLDDGQAGRPLVSFRGVIVDKQVRADGFDQQRRLLRPRRSNSAPQQAHHFATPSASTHSSPAIDPSSTWPLSGKLYLRVRDEQSAHMVDLYVPLGQRPYPAGLLIGAVVAVSGAVRKLSPAWKIYVDCDESTDIRVVSPASTLSCTSPSFAFSAAVPTPSQPLSTTPLSSFSPCPVVVSQLVHRTRCRIHAVKRLSFAVHCLRCALPLPPANERRQRKSPCGAGGCTRIEFRANAYVQVDDGTGTALIVADGELVCRLLGLSRHEWDEVKKYVGQWGQLHYDASQLQLHQHEHDSRRLNKRQREEEQRANEAMDDDDTVNQSRQGVEEPDIAAMQRERLFTLFRSKPRLRLAIVHCQQLVLTKDVDAFMERRKKQQEMRAAVARQAAGTPQQCSAVERGLEASLVSAVPHDFTVGGLQLTTSKPAGVVMLRALECEDVDVRAETVMLLRQQMQQAFHLDD